MKRDDLAFKVRLAGIDCPESQWKEMPEQPFAKAAKQALTGWILKKSVILKQHGIGGYNRILAEVFLGRKKHQPGPGQAGAWPRCTGAACPNP